LGDGVEAKKTQSEFNYPIKQSRAIFVLRRA